MGMRSVFHDDQAMLARGFKNRVHIGRVSGEVNRDDGTRGRRDGLREPLRIEVVSGRLYIDKDWNGPYTQYGSCAGDKRDGGNNYFIAGSNAGSE